MLLVSCLTTDQKVGGSNPGERQFGSEE